MQEGQSRAVGQAYSPGEDSRSLLQLLAQRGHLDVEGGRERDRSQVGEGGEEEVPDSQESSCGHL